MFYVALALLAHSPVEDMPATRSSASQVMQVSARILKGAEASERVLERQGTDRTRHVVEQLSDGREIALVVFDYE